MSKLQDLFISDFIDKNFTAKEVYRWYCEVKSNPDRKPYRSEIYSLILDPLLHKGVIIKLTKGVYQVANQSEGVISTSSTGDDWDSYIKSKLR